MKEEISLQKYEACREHFRKQFLNNSRNLDIWHFSKFEK